MQRYPQLDFLMEFKYVSLGQVGLTAKDAPAKSEAEIKALPKVKAEMNAAKSQVTAYQQSLCARYGPKLRLHSFAIVSLAFEHLVWERVE